MAVVARRQMKRLSSAGIDITSIGLAVIRGFKVKTIYRM